MKLNDIALNVAVQAYSLKPNQESLNIGRFISLFAFAVAAFIFATDASAATLKETAVNVFNIIYGVVGVVGAILLILAALNWAMGWGVGSDPKKMFFNTLFGVGAALATVTIILAVKDVVGADDNAIDEL